MGYAWHYTPTGAFHTPRAGGKVDRQNLTQVGVALDKLGIEHIPSYSPQGRGRGERLNRTLQDRLVNELRVAGITDMAAANKYLNQVFIPDFNQTFGRSPRDQQSVFVSCKGTDLNQIFCIEAERVVNKDNTIFYETKTLQLEPQPNRRTCVGLHVLVRHHLDGSYSIWKGPHLLGTYNAKGQATKRSKKRRHNGQNRCAGAGGYPPLHRLTSALAMTLYHINRPVLHVSK